MKDKGLTQVFALFLTQRLDHCQGGLLTELDRAATVEAGPVGAGVGFPAGHARIL